ncbi:DUF4097 family beta strand repeat-containing protein [Hymenobacter radiodurans]|uniref:DUF4097 family beta strand repeat-containing protein n=1 Tax=Hymenobacter radiodurans TaxID=2496028 RepID=UPI0010587B4F|nr:DUF4097 family beta strand repeat-containing protein [Hymenobacter radiodurans]
MKRSFLPSLIGLLVLLSSCQLWAQDRENTEKINKEFTLTGDAARSTLAVYNIFGSVRVQGYSGNKVVVEATKTITGPDAKTIEQGVKEVKLGFEQRGDSVIAYISEPYDSRPRRNNNRNNDRDIEYKATIDYVVKVPSQMHVHVSTVNDGEVMVQDVSGSLRAYNVNGAVTLKNVKGTTKARTVNGNVEATYLASPPEASSYNTINGDIKVTYPANFSADVHFKSMHGELFTDFPQVETLPVQVTQNKQSTGSGTKYKLTKDTAVRLGKGGKDFRFETLNGDVTIKQQTK